MNKTGFVITRGVSTKEYFTSSSAYDRPTWVPLKEATTFATAELAQQAAKKLWGYGAYASTPISISEARGELEGLPPEDVELLGQPADDELDDELAGEDETGYGADGELDGEAIPSMDGEDETGYGADGELDGEAVPAMDGEGEGGITFEMPDENDENDENAISTIELDMVNPRRRTTESLEGERTFQTYSGWRRAVKAIKPDAEFYGDKDIGGARGIGEWDGAEGVIFSNADRASQARTDDRADESILHELSKNTLKSYLKKAIGSTRELIEKGDMVKGVKRAKNAAWANGKIKEKMYAESATPVVDSEPENTAEYTNKPGCDKAAKAPRSMISALRSVAAGFDKTARAYEDRDAVRASQDLTIAGALKDLADDLSAGTLEGIKQAQIRMTSYMSPITQHIPADVVKFIAKGGKTDSLQNMFSSKWDQHRSKDTK